MMNRALPEMLPTPENLLGNCTDMSVLERQGTRLQWQLQHQKSHQDSEQSYFNGPHFDFLPLSSTTQPFQGGVINDDSIIIRDLSIPSMENPDLENGYPDFGMINPIPRTGFSGERAGFVSPGSGSGSGSGSAHMDHSISRTSSSPPMVAEEKGRGKRASSLVKERFKKRKADNTKVDVNVVTEETKGKKIKGDAEEEEMESKITEQINNNNNNSNITRETSPDNSKENSKVSEVQKPDYIHVRARRGQATDSHSLAERVRREKISERMKYLQDLVPGCNKIIGKAGMLDEIINYVQSLQRQVEFLSMKLATVNPKLEINMNNFAKEIFPSCTDDFPKVEMLTELVNPDYLRFNPVLQQVISCCGLDMEIYPPEMSLGRTNTSAPVPMPEVFADSSCFSQTQPSFSTWETDLPSFYNVEFHQGRQSTFPSQPFKGTLETDNLKMEM